MNQWSRVPEYILETPSEKIIHSTAQLKDTKSICMDQVAAELRLLSVELNISVGILGKIRDSLHVLVQSVQEQE